MNNAVFEKEYDSKISGFRRQANQDVSVFKTVILKCLQSGVVEGKEAIILKRVSQNLPSYPSNKYSILADISKVIKILDMRTGQELSETNSRLQGVILDLSELYDRLSGIKTKIAEIAKILQDKRAI
ncbi:MAG: hypothetical protein M0P12_00400 [Paludibacteraceae bacterium]|nr:hypothetical protein [Paludibacteraceae bacterium]MCK9629766.1 hypothetical protein [Bacteroidales bacterium]